MLPVAHRCKDCGEDADPEYTMDYRDVAGGGFLYWCAACGAEAQKMVEIIHEAFETNPAFAAQFEAKIDEAEKARDGVH